MQDNTTLIIIAVLGGLVVILLVVLAIYCRKARSHPPKSALPTSTCNPAHARNGRAQKTQLHPSTPSPPAAPAGAGKDQGATAVDVGTVHRRASAAPFMMPTASPGPGLTHGSKSKATLKKQLSGRIPSSRTLESGDTNSLHSSEGVSGPGRDIPPIPSPRRSPAHAPAGAGLVINTAASAHTSREAGVPSTGCESPTSAASFARSPTHRVLVRATIGKPSPLFLGKPAQGSDLAASNSGTCSPLSLATRRVVKVSGAKPARPGRPNPRTSPRAIMRRPSLSQGYNPMLDEAVAAVVKANSKAPQR